MTEIALYEKQPARLRILFKHGAVLSGASLVATCMAARRLSGLSILTLLLDCSGVNIDTARDHYGRSPLTASASKGRAAAVSLLLDRGVSIDAVDDGGKTALQCAVEHGRHKTACLLLHRGASRLLPDDTAEIPDLPTPGEVQHFASALAARNPSSTEWDTVAALAVPAARSESTAVTGSSNAAAGAGTSGAAADSTDVLDGDDGATLSSPTPTWNDDSREIDSKPVGSEDGWPIVDDDESNEGDEEGDEDYDDEEEDEEEDDDDDEAENSGGDDGRYGFSSHPDEDWFDAYEAERAE